MKVTGETGQNSGELFCCRQPTEKIKGQGKDKISIKGGSHA